MKFFIIPREILEINKRGGSANNMKIKVLKFYTFSSKFRFSVVVDYLIVLVSIMINYHRKY